MGQTYKRVTVNRTIQMINSEKSHSPLHTLDYSKQPPAAGFIDVPFVFINCKIAW
jgi:hypothetical protein